MKNLLFKLLLLLLPYASNAQFFVDSALSDSLKSTSAIQKFGMRFNSTAFFKNNEYFHPLVEGYTLPGFYIQPRFYYDIDNKFKLEAGIHLSQFSGKKGLNSVDPLFRATYSPTQNFSILLGWLNSTSNHRLIEPLYQWERMYTHPLEYGVQFLVNKEAFKLDTWIDWERYIELNDPFQEELTFGTTSKICLYKNEGLEFWVPVQVTIKHKGGQIISNDIPLKTLANWTTGLDILLYQSFSVLKRLALDLNYVGFSDLSPQKKQAFKNGYGLYPVLSANISVFQASLGYWYGNHFISSKGEPLLLSASETNPLVVLPGRQVITVKTSFYKQIFPNVSFGAYAESYYDLKISQMDYDYGISMTISGDVLLKQKQVEP